MCEYQAPFARLTATGKVAFNTVSQQHQLGRRRTPANAGHPQQQQVELQGD
jgi:hypothetical protein